jgi:hypothetical protein
MRIDSTNINLLSRFSFILEIVIESNASQNPAKYLNLLSEKIH